MTISQTALQAMFAQETGEIFLCCLTITDASLPQPMRLVNDRVDLIRASGTYIAYPFQINLPQDAEDEMPRVQLTVDNIDRQIVQFVRNLTDTPTVTLEVVLRSSPNTVESGPYDFVVKSASYDAMQVSFELGYEADLLSLPSNKWRITPTSAQGSF